MKANQILSVLAAVFCSGPSFGFDLEDLLTTPPQDPCALFETGDDFVRFYIDMKIEGGEVAMRVPKVFLEDRFDHQNDGIRPV